MEIPLVLRQIPGSGFILRDICASDVAASQAVDFSHALMAELIVSKPQFSMEPDGYLGFDNSTSLTLVGKLSNFRCASLAIRFCFLSKTD